MAVVLSAKVLVLANEWSPSGFRNGRRDRKSLRRHSGPIWWTRRESNRAPGIGLPARSRQVASETDVEIGSHFAVTQDPSVTATLRSPVRRDSGETYQEFLTRLAQASGIETPTRADLARLDRKRPKKAQFSVTPLMEQSVEVWP